jgi:hypothetical protein
MLKQNGKSHYLTLRYNSEIDLVVVFSLTNTQTLSQCLLPQPHNQTSITTPTASPTNLTENAEAPIEIVSELSATGLPVATVALLALRKRKIRK